MEPGVRPGGKLFIGGLRVRKVTPTGTITTVGELSLPFVAVDPAGRLLAGGGGRVYRIDPSGATTLVAGSGGAGDGELDDGGPATAAALGRVAGLAVDGQGSIYISDGRRLRVRRVDAAGTISTFAGNGSGTFSGDGRAATEARMWRVGVQAGGPSGAYVSDDSNNRIRRIDPTGTITSVTDTAARGMAQDRSGNLYYSRPDDRRVFRRAVSGETTVVAGTGAPGSGGDDGPATDAQINFPWGIAVDGPGNVYIADYAGGTIRRVTPAGVISTYVGPRRRTRAGRPDRASHSTSSASRR